MTRNQFLQRVMLAQSAMLAQLHAGPLERAATVSGMFLTAKACAEALEEGGVPFDAEPMVDLAEDFYAVLRDIEASLDNLHEVLDSRLGGPR